jgi:DNA-binding transcriptional LysR family regulator
LYFQEGRKVFFFEKKKQKTFIPLRALPARRAPQAKVFWFFFSKKNILLCPMQVRALEVFVELARSASIRQAAHRLNLAPTAISRHIDQLEYYFRAKLIDRTPGGIVLTEAGRVLAQQAQGLVSEAENTRTLIDDLRGLQRGQATISASGAVVSGLVAPALCRIHATHPRLRFHVDVASAGEVYAAVAEGVADLGITIFPPQDDGRAKIAICHSSQMRHAMIVSPGHPLARLACVSMKTLCSQALAIPDTAFGVRRKLERMAKAACVRLDPVFVTGSLDLQKELAIRGAAALVLPPLCCAREIASGLLVAVDLAEDSAIETALELCRTPDRTLTFAAQTLLSEIVVGLANTA